MTQRSDPGKPKHRAKWATRFPVPCFLSSLFLSAFAPAALAQDTPPPREPLAYTAAAKFPDAAALLSPGRVHLSGYLGQRAANNATNRLLQVEEAPLLAGFQKKPGSHPWIGEHVGKWLHAATLAWANTGDPALRAKMDQVARKLIAAQEPDGYLGTYTPDKRFGLYPGADWDVWSHKYNLIGLLTYHRYTGSPEALAACRKMGDLLIATFGPGKRSILSAGTHVGMAATSVLEPVVLLHRMTGDARYLGFAKYLVAAWDEPKGPKVLATLTTEKAVNKTANGKAYEMLSNLVGLCELARVTGEQRYLTPAVNAWKDIVAHQRYLTGTASYGEHFHDNHDLPNRPGANIGETCVTVTWIQLNSQLLRLTGQARYGDEIERSLYNHLSGAQRPDGREWCYYTALEGTKPYGPGINCCVSSGPRGMAMVPELAYLAVGSGKTEALAVNLFEPSRATLRLDNQWVTVEQKTDFPRSGKATLLTFRMSKPATFGLQIRTPDWARPLTVGRTAGRPTPTSPRDGWTVLPARQWKDGDTVRLDIALTSRMVLGQHGNAGRAAMTWGPFVMAYDEAKNPGLPSSAALSLTEKGSPRPTSVSTAGGGTSAAAPAIQAMVRRQRDAAAAPLAAVFVPFAEAGASGSRYRVWLYAPGSEGPRISDSLLSDGQESRSREGNVGGSIQDGDPDSFVVTFNGEALDEDWFAVALDKPVAIGRVVFRHGRTFHDGGWFDTSAGKPRVQVQRVKGGPWETIGALNGYPATTATRAGKLKNGQAFTLRLNQPVQAVAVRVVGKPAQGDGPAQAFSSCAELEAFTK